MSGADHECNTFRFFWTMNGPKGFVLYVDHESHPAPITECFIATAGYRLASRVRRYPAAVAETMESAYCPSCLDQNFYDPLTAVEQQGGYCPVCVQCPDCFATLSIQKINNESSPQYKYQCGRCDYSFTDVAADTVQALQDILKQQRENLLAPYAELMEYATKKWSSRKNSAEKPTLNPRQVWSIELLEAKIKKCKERTEQKHVAELETTKLIQRKSIHEILKVKSEPLDLDAGLVSTSLTQQVASWQMQPRTDNRLPLRTHLFVRRSLRCRAELAEGRPGILLKPKLGPLEGDSSAGLSSNASHQWHRKDSSAIHIVPRIRFVAQKTLEPDKDGDVWHCGLLLMTNPTLGKVRVQFSSSQYRGEPRDRWDSCVERSLLTAVMSNVVVDSLRQQHFDVVLPIQDSLSEARFPAEVIELNSAEDAMFHGSFSNIKFLHSSIPERWPEEVVGRVIAIKGHVALLQVASRTPVVAVTLSVVDIGNGSWEASLLRNRSSVSFDLVLGFGECNISVSV